MPNPTDTDCRSLSCCERGTAEHRMILHLPHPASARSTLEVPITRDVTGYVLLPPRHTLLLLVLADAWIKDEGRVETQRGFRTAEELNDLLGNPENTEPLSETCVRAYVTATRRSAREEIARMVKLLRLGTHHELELHELIESRRKTGYRIGTRGLEILKPRTAHYCTG